MRKHLIPIAALIALLAAAPGAEAKRKYQIVANVTDEFGSIEICALGAGSREIITDTSTFTFSQSGYLPGRVRTNGIRKNYKSVVTEGDPYDDGPDITDQSVPYSETGDTADYVRTRRGRLGYGYRVGIEPPRYAWLKLPKRVGRSVRKTFTGSSESEALPNDGCSFDTEPGWTVTGSVTVTRVG